MEWGLPGCIGDVSPRRHRVVVGKGVGVVAVCRFGLAGLGFSFTSREVELRSSDISPSICVGSFYSQSHQLTPLDCNATERGNKQFIL